MELMQEVKGYSDSREEEEEEEAAEITATTGEESSRLREQDAAANSINHDRKQVDFMELSLGSNREEGSKEEERVEKEHMFDKVVTPSDVGKLNRLVIPKQYAEKYFPLDSSSNEKGLLLNFEDRNGKLWRFRYSYWNSSQSYVMTKGWSRFVKEKKLDAGDIVSFHRGLGELYRHRLYIDWRRRPDHVPHPSSSLSLITTTAPFFLPNHYNYNIACGRLYSLPSPPPTSSTPRYHGHFHHPLNYNATTFHQPQHRGDHLNSGSAGSLYYLTSPATPSMSTADQQDRGNILPMIIDSVPVAHHHHHHHHHRHHNRGGTGAVITAAASNNASTTGKRLRLFGVNMECASSPASAPHVAMPSSLPSSSLQRLSLPHQDPLSSSATFGDQRGATSVLFDLDPSPQYRQ